MEAAIRGRVIGLRMLMTGAMADQKRVAPKVYSCSGLAKTEARPTRPIAYLPQFANVQGSCRLAVGGGYFVVFAD